MHQLFCHFQNPPRRFYQTNAAPSTILNGQVTMTILTVSFPAIALVSQLLRTSICNGFTVLSLFDGRRTSTHRTHRRHPSHPTSISTTFGEVNEDTCTSATHLCVGPQQLGTFEAITADDDPATRQVRFLDLSNHEPIAFEQAWSYQKQILQAHVERMSEVPTRSQFIPTKSEDEDDETTGVDTFIMLQHRPVYTLGTGSDPSFVLASNSDIPTVRMDRGGEV